MKLHFDPNQEYQLKAIESIVDIFEGQPLGSSEFEFAITEGSLLFTENGVGNNVVLSENQLLENLRKIQERNDIEPVSEELEGLNFTVEMETGTGKTYVYLRTIYELNKTYGFKKFLIVVPSVAIREGVLKNLEITRRHFQNLYDNVPVTFDVYDSGKVSILRGFASSNTVQILVINIDSFAKDENIINKPNDKLTGKKPVEFIQYTRPIVIVDEPQNMETEIRKRAIANLNPFDDSFIDIWNRIKHKTTYRVKYDTNELIKSAAKAILEMPEIRRPMLKSVKTGLKYEAKGVEGDILGSKTIEVDTSKFEIPDVLGYIQSKTELTRSTILRILKMSTRLNDLLINPQLFLDSAVKEIRQVLYDLMIDGIKYEKIGGQKYEMHLFEEHEIEIYKDRLAFPVKEKGKTIYSNYMPLDSNVEEAFAKECETREDIEFYFKLPSWFKIKTPIGSYNPDWALIFKNERKIYFVAETKSAGQELRTSEKRKIKCGQAHFNEFEDVEYRQVATVGEFNSMEVQDG